VGDPLSPQLTHYNTLYTKYQGFCVNFVNIVDFSQIKRAEPEISAPVLVKNYI